MSYLYAFLLTQVNTCYCKSILVKHNQYSITNYLFTMEPTYFGHGFVVSADSRTMVPVLTEYE